MKEYLEKAGEAVDGEEVPPAPTVRKQKVKKAPKQAAKAAGSKPRRSKEPPGPGGERELLRGKLRNLRQQVTGVAKRAGPLEVIDFINPGEDVEDESESFSLEEETSFEHRRENGGEGYRPRHHQWGRGPHKEEEAEGEKKAREGYSEEGPCRPAAGASRACLVSGTREREEKRRKKKREEGSSGVKALVKLLKGESGERRKKDVGVKKEKKEKTTRKAKEKRRRKKTGHGGGSDPSSSEETEGSYRTSQSGEEDDESSSAEMLGPLQKRSARKPGAMLKMLVDHARAVMDQSALVSTGDAGVTTGVKLASYFSLMIRPYHSSTSRDMKELHHLSVCLDQLRGGDLGGLGDSLASRFLAVHTVVNDGTWRSAQYLEMNR